MAWHAAGDNSAARQAEVMYIELGIENEPVDVEEVVLESSSG